MKLTQTRFTVRRMMVVVAVVAITIVSIDSAAKLSHLGRAYRAQVKFLAESERHDLEMATTYDRQSAVARAAGDEKRAYALTVEARQARKYAAQYAEWTRSYEVAVSRPWRSLPPGTIKLMVQPPPSPVDIVPYTLRALGTPATTIVLSCSLCLIWVGFRVYSRRNRQSVPGAIPETPGV